MVGIWSDKKCKPLWEKLKINNHNQAKTGREKRSKQLPEPPPISFPLLPPSSLLHTLLITADFPLAITIVSDPPTHPLTHHSQEGWVCPQHGSVTSRAFPPLGVARCLSEQRNSSTWTCCNIQEKQIWLNRHDTGEAAMFGRCTGREMTGVGQAVPVFSPNFNFQALCALGAISSTLHHAKTRFPN